MLPYMTTEKSLRVSNALYQYNPFTGSYEKILEAPSKKGVDPDEVMMWTQMVLSGYPIEKVDMKFRHYVGTTVMQMQQKMAEEQAKYKEEWRKFFREEKEKLVGRENAKAGITTSHYL